MSLIDRARELAINTKKQYPQLADTVNDLFDLFLDEIEQGESAQNELDHFESDIEDLINDDVDNLIRRALENNTGFLN